MAMDDVCEVGKAEDARYEATLAADVSTLARLLHDDLVYGHSTGSVDSKATYLDALENGNLTYHRIEQHERRVMVRDAVALVFSRMVMDVTVNGAFHNLTNRTLGVWQRSDQSWRLLASHSTPLGS